MSTHLLENSLLEAPRSWDGDPLPDLDAAAILAEELRPLEMPNGDRMAPAEEGSPGDEFAVGEVDRFWPLADCGG